MTTRACATCGTPFPVAANNPHRRYCTPRCRVADWHRRHDRPPAAERPNGVGNAVANGVTANGVGYAAPPPGATPASTRCPHCGQPVAVINLLVTPAAARGPNPPTHHG